MTGTGFMKCIPMTLSGLFVAPANYVIEIEEVLLAIMAYGFKRWSSVCRTDFLTFAF
jgi:hypothetical protein